MSVTYTAVLEVSEDSVLFLSGLLHAERTRRGTRAGRRALGTYKQAVLVLRWLFDDTRTSALARDSGIWTSTAYAYRDDGVAVLAARQPSLHGALLAATTAGHTHVVVDGTLIYTDRTSVPGPTPGVDLWCSGRHHHHGGNIQVVPAPDGWPLWTSDVRPGREHDMTTARADPDLLTRIDQRAADGQLTPADPGHEDEPATFTTPSKKPPNAGLTIDQQTYNAVHGALRRLGERASSLPKTTFTAPRRYRGCPWRPGDIAAALVLPHHEHGHTT
ncbi:MAG TPA: transposase family protein [Mycobacteriales bacterium]|nr:transposase family protein [Mycobacteriales bacterium]